MMFARGSVSISQDSVRAFNPRRSVGSVSLSDRQRDRERVRNVRVCLIAGA